MSHGKRMYINQDTWYVLSQTKYTICIYLTYMYGTAHMSIPAWASHMGVVHPCIRMSCPYTICQLCCHYFLFQCFFCLDPYFILTIFIGLISFCQCIQLYTCHFSIESASSLSMGMIIVLQQISGVCSEYKEAWCKGTLPLLGFRQSVVNTVNYLMYQLICHSRNGSKSQLNVCKICQNAFRNFHLLLCFFSVLIMLTLCS